MRPANPISPTASTTYYDLLDQSSALSKILPAIIIPLWIMFPALLAPCNVEERGVADWPGTTSRRQRNGVAAFFASNLSSLLPPLSTDSTDSVASLHPSIPTGVK